MGRWDTQICTRPRVCDAIAADIVRHARTIAARLAPATEVTGTFDLSLLGAISLSGGVDGVVGGRELQGGRGGV